MIEVLKAPRYRLSVLVIATALAAAAATQPAQAAQARRVLQNPATVDRPGTYEVGVNFASPGDGVAIHVLSSDVTIDFRGHTIEGPGDLQGVGILVEGADNVRIMGGGLAGFHIGVQVVDATNVLVEGMQIDGNDLGGSPPAVEIGVMLVNSRGVLVSGNTITDTFLGIFVRGELSGGNRITGNTIAGGDQGQLAICYNPAPGMTMGGPDGDLVIGNHVGGFNLGLSLSADSTGNVVRDNSFATYGQAIIEATMGSNEILDNATIMLTP